VHCAVDAVLSRASGHALIDCILVPVHMIQLYVAVDWNGQSILLHVAESIVHSYSHEGLGSTSSCCAS
jgi:hypothetical protein